MEELINNGISCLVNGFWGQPARHVYAVPESDVAATVTVSSSDTEEYDEGKYSILQKERK